MSTPVIKVENLSKQYRIGERESYKTFREAITNLVKAPFRRNNGSKSHSEVCNPDSGMIWALKDVSFEVRQGDIVGVIGRNGAGKSTLLKVLSKITEPSEGKIELRGRVGSLLEVGTGFHPELTGHENVYLYGAILGMDRWEVTRKFDEIIAFAELENFTDTPVKRYSSGMYMRLAFAVAAHLETELLLVDEVLAVGDLAFQRKCIGKMGDLSKNGRTVLFVSHNMGAINNLCDSVLFLNNGEKVLQGTTDDAIRAYMSGYTEISAEWIAKISKSKKEEKEKINLLAVRVRDELGILRSEFTNQETVIIEIDVEIKELSPDLKIGFEIEGEFGDVIFTSFHNDIKNILRYNEFEKGQYSFRAKIPYLLLNSKVYYISPCAGIHKKRWIFRKQKLVKFHVDFQVINKKFFVSKRPGIIGPLLEWEIQPTNKNYK